MKKKFLLFLFLIRNYFLVYIVKSFFILMFNCNVFLIGLRVDIEKLEKSVSWIKGFRKEKIFRGYIV